MQATPALLGADELERELHDRPRFIKAGRRAAVEIVSEALSLGPEAVAHKVILERIALAGLVDGIDLHLRFDGHAVDQQLPGKWSLWAELQELGQVRKGDVEAERFIAARPNVRKATEAIPNEDIIRQL